MMWKLDGFICIQWTISLCSLHILFFSSRSHSTRNRITRLYCWYVHPFSYHTAAAQDEQNLLSHTIYLSTSNSAIKWLQLEYHCVSTAAGHRMQQKPVRNQCCGTRKGIFSCFFPSPDSVITTATHASPLQTESKTLLSVRRATPQCNNYTIKCAATALAR